MSTSVVAAARVRWPAVLIILIAPVACMPAGDASRVADSAAAAASLRAGQESGAALANRDEAQDHIEAAREAFLADDQSRAAAELRASAETARRHASNAEEPAKSALMLSSQELDAFAARVLDGGLSAVPAMDSAFARHHLAEARYHCLRAEAAWGERKVGPAAAEMLMLADHFERAARDVQFALKPEVVDRIATLRSVATMLAQTGQRGSLEVDLALSAVDVDVHGLETRVGPGRF